MSRSQVTRTIVSEVVPESQVFANEAREKREEIRTTKMQVETNLRKLEMQLRDLEWVEGWLDKVIEDFESEVGANGQG